MIVAGCGGGNGTTSSTAQSDPESEQPEPSSSEPLSVGEAGQVEIAYSDLDGSNAVDTTAEVTLVEVKDDANPDDELVADSIEKEGHRWAALEFEVENTGEDAFFDNMVLGVIDKTGAEYPGEGLSVFAPALDDVNLNPGEKRRGVPCPFSHRMTSTLRSSKSRWSEPRSFSGSSSKADLTHAGFVRRSGRRIPGPIGLSLRPRIVERVRLPA